MYAPLCFLCGFWLEDQEGGGSEKSGQSGKWKWFGLQNDGDVRYHHVEYPTLFFALTQSEAALYEQRPKGLSAEQDKQRKRVRDKLQDAYNKHKVVVGASAGKAATSACSSQKTAGAGSSRSDISASPATAVKPPRAPKRTRPPGRAKKGCVWDGYKYVWDAATAKADEEKAAEDKANREAKGLRGPGRPPLPRDPVAETKGAAADVAVKEKDQAVLSSFMREHEALATQQPEWNARVALERDEPNDTSAQKVIDDKHMCSARALHPSPPSPHYLSAPLTSATRPPLSFTYQ